MELRNILICTQLINFYNILTVIVMYAANFCRVKTSHEIDYLKNPLIYFFVCEMIYVFLPEYYAIN